MRSRRGREQVLSTSCSCLLAEAAVAWHRVCMVPAVVPCGTWGSAEPSSAHASQQSPGVSSLGPLMPGYRAVDMVCS